MESNRAVLGNPGDNRSGMSICIVVHAMKDACKYVACFCRLATALSRVSNSSFTLAKCILTDVDH